MARGIQRQYYRWLTIGIVFIVAVLAATAVFNYRIDSLGLFHPNKGLSHAVKSLFDGKMVAGPMSYDERDFQRIVVEMSDKPFEVIAIGSSRTMVLRKRFVGPDRSFFNHSVAAASLEDIISVVGIYRARGMMPQTVILGLDPWMFKEKNGLVKWQSIGLYYKKMLAEIYGKDVTINLARRNKFQELINLEYTLENISSIKKGKAKRLYLTATADIDDFVREPDGSIQFPYVARYKKDEETQSLARQWIARPENHLTNFTAVANMRIFEDFVTYLQKHGTKVVFFLPPFHPITYEKIRETTRIVEEVETSLRALADKKGIQVLGSYDPTPFGLTSRDFFDGTHGHEVVPQRIFQGQRL
jgi:hypothetical protein